MKSIRLNSQKGITLVALIITIIVLLILAIVSIRLVMNGGIIDKSKSAVDKYSEEELQEQIKLAYSDWQLGQYTGETRTAAKYIQDSLNKTYGEGAVTNVIETDGVFTVTFSDGREYSYNISTGKTEKVAKWNDNGDGSWTHSITGKKLQVGDIVKYETELAKTANAVNSTKKAGLITDLGTYSGNTDTIENTDSSVVRDSLTWKVLDVKDGKIRLISEVPTSSKIKLYGADGYNNAVYLLDKACDTLYSIEGVGKAQNLKIEDIEEKIDKTKFDYTQYANPSTNITYGGTKEYTSNLKYPNIYSSEVGCKAIAADDNTGNTLGLSQQSSPITGSSTATNRLKVTQTYWNKSMASTDFTDSKYYNLFINNGSNLATYWLSSRCVYCGSGGANFYVRNASSRNVNFCNMFSSLGSTGGGICAFRPVVSLESNIQLSGSSSEGWTIQ